MGNYKRDMERQKEMSKYDYIVTISYGKLEEKHTTLFLKLTDAIAFMASQMKNTNINSVSLERRRSYVYNHSDI